MHILGSQLGTIFRERRPLFAAVIGGLALPALVGVVVGALLIQIGHGRDQASATRRSFETQAQLQRLFSTLQDAETGQRGYLLTGSSAFLAPYDRAAAKLDGEFLWLDRLLSDDRAQRDRVSKLRAVAREKLGELELTIRLFRRGEVAAAFALVRMGHGKRLMDGVRLEVDQMDRAEAKLLAENLRAAGRADTGLLITVDVLLGLLLILAVFAAWLAKVSLQEIARQRTTAERANEAKSDFLANMSHELRTPLTSIVGFASLASAQADLSPRTRTYVERVGEASRALICTVNDILDFAKLEAGQISLRLEPTCIASVARGTLDLFTPQAGAKDLDLILDDGAEGADQLFLAVDPDRIRQILLNLIGNAVKFTVSGSVIVRTAMTAWQSAFLST